MRFCKSAVIIALSLASPAVLAADLGLRGSAPPMEPRLPYVAFYDWTGFYLGANIGYGWTSGSGNMTLAGVPGTYSGSGNGVLGGLQAGYNWQSGALVFGVETDIQVSGARGDVNGVAGAAVVTGSAKTPYFGTIRGRLGYAADSWLLYVTAGGLYGKSTLDGVVSTTGPFSASSTYWTYVVGGGAEFALWNRWTAKLEYLYAGTPSSAPVSPATTSLSGSGHTHIVRTGVNYRF
jgi:outer membrane immunogenic protein